MNSKPLLSKIITNRKGAEYRCRKTGNPVPKRIRMERRPGVCIRIPIIDGVPQV